MRKSFCNPDTLSQRFWAKVDKLSDQGCWLWTGAISGSGHGLIGCGDKLLGAHRVSWRLHFGHFPDADVVHVPECPNIRCVAPHHLAIRNGKTTHGKLTPDIVREIRASNQTLQALADKYGVSDSAISLVKLRRTWKHIA